MVDQQQLNIVKAMAWERAKGELRSIAHCFYSDDRDTMPEFEKWDARIEDFIKDIEDNGIGGFL